MDVYRLLRSNITEELVKGIENRLQILYRCGLINEEMMKYCKPPNKPSTARLYYLTKIHKNPHKERPIVASCKSITENISQFVDHWLQPVMQILPSFVRDTTEFVNLLERNRFNNDVILASIDVSSLYTNIPHREGIETCIQALKNQENLDPLQPAPEVMGELIGLVLKKTCLNLMENISYKYKAQQWGPN